MPAYFYVVLSTVFQLTIVINKYCFQSMVSYNVYIGTLATGKETFSAKLQKIKFFSEYLGTVVKMDSNFA